jgi:hypothetical protein
MVHASAVKGIPIIFTLLHYRENIGEYEICQYVMTPFSFPSIAWI